jgi:hypothetical protein
VVPGAGAVMGGSYAIRVPAGSGRGVWSQTDSIEKTTAAIPFVRIPNSVPCPVHTLLSSSAATWSCSWIVTLPFTR